MSRKSTMGILCLVVLALSAVHLNAQGWLIYDGSVLPAETGGGGDTLDITNVSDNSPGAGMIQEIMDDPDIVGNKIFKYLHPDGKTMFRYRFEEGYTDTSFTMIARVRGENDPLYDRVFDLQWRNGNANSRDELRMWAADSTLELEKAKIEVKANMDLYAWHTYRIAVIGDSATIYIDENPVPAIAGTSPTTSNDKYIKVGDGSDDTIGGYMDWLILNLSGAYAPGEGPAIPEGLEVDEYSTPVEESPPTAPTSFILHQNYPNPFNPTTTIEFALPASQHVTVTVYNTVGEKVITLIDARLSEGSHRVRFDGQSYASGIYFYEVKAGQASQIRKMMLIK